MLVGKWVVAYLPPYAYVYFFGFTLEATFLRGMLISAFHCIFLKQSLNFSNGSIPPYSTYIKLLQC